jgi:hypothetical protein
MSYFVVYIITYWQAINYDKKMIKVKSYVGLEKISYNIEQKWNILFVVNMV